MPGKILLMLALVVLLPVMIILIPILNLFGLNKMKASPDYVAGYLEKFIAGSEGASDWDDFCSIPLADPTLDGIVNEVCSFAPPNELNEAGRDELRRLLAEVKAL